MKKTYIKPEGTIYNIQPGQIIASSSGNRNYEYMCNECCRLWHLCRDRRLGKTCLDKC